MSGWQTPDADGSVARWQALSGDAALPQPPRLSQHPHGELPQQPQPIHGGWQQAWQDASGQWHYPYAAAQPQIAPPYADAAHAIAEPQPAAHPAPAPEPQSAIVEPDQLAPVGPPRYLAPARVAQDPRQRTMAAVITFVALLVGLWAILGFMGSLSKTLTSISSASGKLEGQLEQANVGLAELDEKTAYLDTMAADSKRMSGLLATIDSDMGGMLGGVDRIAASMQAMSGSLATLDTEITRVNEINEGMTSRLAGIDRGLGQQVQSVRTMRRDVEATGKVLGTLPGRLRATNQRLAHVNRTVDIMGRCGVTNQLEVDIFAGPLRTGSAKVFATVVPPASWGSAKGATPC